MLEGGSKKVLIISIIIGALGLVTKNLKSNLEIINFQMEKNHYKKHACWEQQEY